MKAKCDGPSCESAVEEALAVYMEASKKGAERKRKNRPRRSDFKKEGAFQLSAKKKDADQKHSAV